MLAVTQKRSEFERQALVHLDAMYGAAYRLTRNARDAEDLVQDALLRAYRFWDSFQQDSNCKAWLLRSSPTRSSTSISAEAVAGSARRGNG